MNTFLFVVLSCFCMHILQTRRKQEKLGVPQCPERDLQSGVQLHAVLRCHLQYSILTGINTYKHTHTPHTPVEHPLPVSPHVCMYRVLQDTSKSRA